MFFGCILTDEKQFLDLLYADDITDTEQDKKTLFESKSLSGVGIKSFVRADKSTPAISAILPVL